MPENSERDRIASAIRRTVPRRPGVYLYYDRSGRLVYVGKSVNLRERMLSYFRPKGAGLENRIREMVFSIHGFDFCETETELLALLLEDALIKRDLPVYNVRQREYDGYQFLHVTNDLFPTCKVAERLEPVAGHFYGPFHDEYAVEDIVAFVHRHFGIRSCSEPKPVRKCLDFDLGFCTGPCRGKISSEEYAGVVRRTLDFLEGDGACLDEGLHSQIARCSEKREFEKAADLKGQLSFCRRFCQRQRFINEFKTGRLSIHEEGHPAWSYHFERGNLIEAAQTVDGARRVAGIPGPLIEEQTDERFLLDRANLVYVWVNANQGQLRLAECLAAPGS